MPLEDGKLRNENELDALIRLLQGNSANEVFGAKPVDEGHVLRAYPNSSKQLYNAGKPSEEIMNFPSGGTKIPSAPMQRMPASTPFNPSAIPESTPTREEYDKMSAGNTPYMGENKNFELPQVKAEEPSRAPAALTPDMPVYGLANSMKKPDEVIPDFALDPNTTQYDYNPNPLAAAIASFGAGIAGRDQGKVFGDVFQGTKDSMKRQRDQDPNSFESQSARYLSKRMLPSFNPEGKTAEQLFQINPTLKLLYEGQIKRDNGDVFKNLLGAKALEQKAYDDDEKRRLEQQQIDIKNKGMNATIANNVNKTNIAASKVPKTGTPSAKPSDGEKAVDRGFAKEYNHWTEVGWPTYVKNINLLESTKKQLQAMKNDKISPSGRIMGRLPDLLKPEKNIQLRDNVRQAVQGTLKDSLGGQFTEREGEGILNRAYNEKVSPEANIENIDKTLRALKAAAKNKLSKVKHYEGNNMSLKGYKSTSSQQSSPAQEKMIRINTPKGLKQVPQSKLDLYLKKGATLAR